MSTIPYALILLSFIVLRLIIMTSPIEPTKIKIIFSSVEVSKNVIYTMICATLIMVTELYKVWSAVHN